MQASLMTSGNKVRDSSVDVSSGNTPHTSHAVFLPLPAKKEIVSHPVSAWNMGRTKALSRPNVAAMVWAARFFSCFLKRM